MGKVIAVLAVLMIMQGNAYGDSISDMSDDMLNFIAGYTGYEIRGELRVMFASQRLMEREYFGGKAPSYPLVKAIYLPDEDIIIMPLHANMELVEWQGTLLHELVHFLQDQNGEFVHCVKAGEPEAYEVQRAWLRSKGEQVMADALPGAFTIALVSSCMGNIF